MYFLSLKMFFVSALLADATRNPPQGFIRNCQPISITSETALLFAKNKREFKRSSRDGRLLRARGIMLRPPTDPRVEQRVPLGSVPGVHLKKLDFPLSGL